MLGGRAGRCLSALLDGLAYVWPVLAIVGGIFAVIAGFRLLLWYWRRHMLRRSGIREIDAMGGEVFEQYLATLFSRLGYRVELTRFRGDFGGDLVLRKDGVRTAVQAKRHAKTVGIKAVQEAVGAKAYYECEAAMVVTNSYFSRQAVELAEKAGVELWDRDELIERLSKIGERGWWGRRRLGRWRGLSLRSWWSRRRRTWWGARCARSR